MSVDQLMLKQTLSKIDRTNALVGLLVLIAVFAVYYLTKAPTFSFWDCGEFVAAAYTLSVPHPPGAPLFVMVARIFSVLPLAADIAVRINLVSVLSNSFAALFGYLSLVRLFRLWFGQDDSPYSRFLMYAGSASGAFFAAFGLTQWTNSVEAEVYGLMMVMFMACFWLMIIYYEHQDRPLATKVMLLIAFITTLGIGVHLSVFMIFPVAAMLFIMRRETPRSIWFLLATFLFLELYLIFALSASAGEIPWSVPVVIGLVLYAFFLFSFDQMPKVHLLYGLGLVLAATPLLPVFLSMGRSGENLLNWVGVVSLGATSLCALYQLYHLWRFGANGESNGAQGESRALQLAPPLIVLVTLFMVVLLAVELQGYLAFQIITVVLAVLFGWFVRKFIRWPILIAVAALSMVIIGVKPFLYGLGGAAVLILILGLRFRMPQWQAALAILAMAVAGYSVHLFLPIRSSQNPVINQNNPSQGVTTTINFLERKQYGSQSMVERMFQRRAKWVNQFGNFHRMGFWHFFSDQWGLTGRNFFLLFCIGLYGIWELIRRRPRVGLLLLMLLLIGSIGLVLYMNFSDGLMQDRISGRGHIEVRDRDYFFTPFFVLFSLTLGLGLTLLAQYIRELVQAFGKLPRRAILVSLSIILLLPVYAVGGNYYRCDRSANYMPYEYARNLLISCEPNAVLFTGGDNDTFPIWCAQEVYGVRKDVSVVCLPLANTNWYIKQVRDNYGLDLGWSDAKIDSLRPMRFSNGNLMRIQDQLVTSIIDHNASQRPINWSLTTSRSTHAYRGNSIDSLMEQIGMVFRLKGQGTATTIDIERSMELFTSADEFGYRSYNNSAVYKDDASIRSARNLSRAAMIVADSLRVAKDMERAEKLIRVMVERLPQHHDAYYFLATLLAELERLDELREMSLRYPFLDQARLQVTYARGLRRLNRPIEAEAVLIGILKQDQSCREAFDELTRLYVAAREVRGLEGLFAQWVRSNPSDEQVRQSLNRLRQSLGGDTLPGNPDPTS